MLIGQELSFRDVERNEFTWCGKQFRRKADGTVALSMEAYHENLKEIHVPKLRKGDLTSPLEPAEQRQIRASRKFSVAGGSIEV